MITGVTLIDLQKAFDTIRLLLQKLYAIGFSKHTVNWFKSYVSNISFPVNLGSPSCGVHKGSILGSLLFSIYANDMSQAVKYHLFPYADGSCLVYQHKDNNEIEKQLNLDFSNICDWFKYPLW